ncbi:MAG: NAD(+) synthase [Bacteroidales bacterium]|nr:NAD(+) synthase [Bacteroidales bacterium]
MDFGFRKIAAAVPLVKVADCNYNIEQITALTKEAALKNVSLIAFPELSITGYTCADLFHQRLLVEEAENALKEFVFNTSSLEIVTVVGLPVAVGNDLFNVAAVISKGKILGVVPKTYLPNYNEFYEARWFAPSTHLSVNEIGIANQIVPIGTDILFKCDSFNFGVEVCEDLWVPIPPSSYQALNGADIMVNISASNELVGKHNYLKKLIEQQSARTLGVYLYSSAGFGESTTDLVFAGNGIIAENGSIIKESERFSFENQIISADVDIDKMRTLRRKTTTFTNLTGCDLRDYRSCDFALDIVQPKDSLDRYIQPRPFVPSDDEMDERCDEIFNIQVNGLAQRFKHTHSKSAVIGISGGLDSTLALLVCVKTLDKLNIPRKNIVGVTMPGFGTTDRTYNNAINLMKSLGITIREISIKAACIQHFSDLDIDENVHDVTYENSQARERTQILMDIANQTNGMVIGTGDLSELALGWATYNGDHMSMYGVNGSIPKTLVKYLVKWVADNQMNEDAKEILLDVIDTPISPELIPADKDGNISQKTEDLVGPYELHDFFLYNFIRFGFRPKKIFLMAKIAFKGEYDETVIKKWLYTFFRRFFAQQFKRSCLPDGPKVGSVTLSPRGDWRMPSDAVSSMWLKEIESL